MLTIFLSPTAFRPSVPLAPLRPLRSSLPARSHEAAMVTPADIDPILQDMPVFDAPADAGVSPVAAFVVCFLIAFIGSSLMNMPEADDDALAGMSAPPKKKKKKERASPTKIGWLTTDMRVPLPTLEELENGCHLLNTLDGERFYLCTAASKLSESNCELSDDFSAYYNAPVYTCIA